MTAQQRVHWDEKYRAKKTEPYPHPDPLLFEFTPPIMDEAEHRALDLASGVGQNGLWLAAQGYVVDLIDISRVALLRAQVEMGARGLRNVNLYPSDLDSHEFVQNQYEVICVFRYLQRDLFPGLRNAVAPGGRIIYETFNQRYLQTAPDFNPDYLLGQGELAGFFADWRILHHREGKQISQLVAVKP
ncbi:MAG: methyltransferase domain-containing protein [Anaerolineae bacterium]|nr:methyltransferase domain-containing protein [Anaerolineae bacterium]